MKNILDTDNIDAYYDELAKSNMLIELYENGFDLTKIATKFKDMTSQQAYDYCDYIISDSTLKTVNTGLQIVDLASGYEEWVDKWDTGEGVGYKVGYPMLNYHLAGIHKKNLILHLAGIGQGKAQPLYSKILTPNGYVKMKDIKVGDEIFGDDGKVHNVMGVFPQGKKDVYEITFSDGSKARSCDEHLWTVQTPKMRMKNTFKDMTLAEIMEDGLYNININGHKQWKYFIPMTKPLTFKESCEELEIPPYILGLILGDGGLTGESIAITVNNKEPDIYNVLNKYCEDEGLSLNVWNTSGNGTTYRFTDYTSPNRLKAKLEGLGLMGKYSNEKSVPKKYLFASPSDRVELLSGLIDSDGEVNISKYIYSTVSEQLKNDVVFLVQSLGGTANVENRQTYYTHGNKKKAGQPSYRIHIKMPVDIQPIKSQKHIDKFTLGQTRARRCIRNIEYIGKEEAQCIMTSNPSQLYLTDDMIVTHNTTSAISTYVIPVLESGESICILANEQDEEQFRQMLLATVVFNKIKYMKMNRQKFLFGGFTGSDRHAITEAIEWLKQYEGKLHYGHLTDYRTESISRIVKKYSKIGVGIFLH